MAVLYYRDPADGTYKPLTLGGGGGAGSDIEVIISATQPTEPLNELWVNLLDPAPPAAASTGCPTGMVAPWAGTVAPMGWLLCNGQAVSRSSYALLYSVCSTAYGVGDGSTTFNVPDLRGKVVTAGGAGSFTGARGTVVGTETHTLTEAQMPSHAHTVYDPGHAHGVSDPTHAHGVADPTHGHMQTVSTTGSGDWTRKNYNGEGASNKYRQEVTTEGSLTGIGIYGSGTGIGIYGAGTSIGINATGGGTAHNIIQPTMVLAYIIKA